MSKRKYTEEQLMSALKDCRSIRQILSKLGLKEAGGNYKTIKNFKGYLFLSLQSFSTFYFNEFNDINVAGLTWNIQTAYFIDKGGENYHAPQLNILPSK